MNTWVWSIFILCLTVNSSARSSVFKSEALRLEQASNKLSEKILSKKANPVLIHDLEFTQDVKTKQNPSPANAKTILSLLKLNASRWEKWKSPNEEPFILVDIAGYQVFYFEKEKRVYQTRALVGQASTPTPVFKTEINKIVLNPWWIIPKNIVMTEVLPVLKKDLNLIHEGQLVVFKEMKKGLRKVSISELKTQLEQPAESFPFIVKQRPGEGNPLGNIKFTSKHPNSIFLHGTIEPELFSANQRAVSHGCVRLENPVALAQWILKRQGLKIDLEKLSHRKMNSEETVIKLSKSVPIYFGYWTAWADNDLNYHLREDIYGLDKIPHPAENSYVSLNSRTNSR